MLLFAVKLFLKENIKIKTSLYISISLEFQWTVNGDKREKVCALSPVEIRIVMSACRIRDKLDAEKWHSEWKNTHFFLWLLLTQYCSAQLMDVPSGRKNMECISNSSLWEDCQCIGVCLHSHRVPTKSKSSICLGHVKTSGSRTGEPAVDRWGISPRLIQE